MSNISFNLLKGDVLVLAGPSGSGKSTISFAMNGIIPWREKGLMKGEVQIYGRSVWDYNFTDLSKTVSLVKQNPLEQLVTFTVRDEIAFGLENLRYPKDQIERKVNEIAEFMGIKNLLDRNLDYLSGGQKQLTILCSFLVIEPKILIMDEPIAFLDQNSESLLLDRLHKLTTSKKFDLTLIIIEHRLSRVIDIANKIIILNDDGSIKIQGDIQEALQEKYDVLKLSNVRVPWIIDIFYTFKKDNTRLQNLKNPRNFQSLLNLLKKLEIRELLHFRNVLMDSQISPTHLVKYNTYEDVIEFEELYIEKLKDKILDETGQKEASEERSIILETKNLTFEYPNTKIQAIKNLSIKIEEGDFIGLIGPNGSGKTTLLYLLANLYYPTSGKILFRGEDLNDLEPYQYAKKVGFIFQNPENMIFSSSIKEEIMYAPKNFGISKKITEEYFNKLIELIGNEKAEKNPFKLSWGQKRRLNLSSIFVYDPEIILLDEPFIGNDSKNIVNLMETLYIENKRGKTIIISSHDYHLLLKYTKKILELNKDGTFRELDKNGSYFSRHKNLGPIILLDKINQRLKDLEGD